MEFALYEAGIIVPQQPSKEISDSVVSNDTQCSIRRDSYAPSAAR